MPTVAIEQCQSYEIDTVRDNIRLLLADLGGVDALLGGSIGTVLIKPNLLSPRIPDEAVTTHPALVRAVVELMEAAGARRIWVGDSCAGAHSDENLWRVTGMRDALVGTKAELRSFHSQVRPWHGGGNRPFPAPAWLDEVDFIVNMPKLKTHALTIITCGVKNMYGMVSGAAKANYHAQYPSPRAMSYFLAEVYSAFKPTLTIVDAVMALEGEGPANGRPVFIGHLLAGSDAAAVDSVCAECLGLTGLEVPLLRRVAEIGQGIIKPDEITRTGGGSESWLHTHMKSSIARHLMRVPEPIFHIVTRVLRCRPTITDSLCVRCGICVELCSKSAIYRDEKNGRLRIDNASCIMCMCCSESCPQHAIQTRSPLGILRRMRAFFRRRAEKRHK